MDTPHPALITHHSSLITRTRWAGALVSLAALAALAGMLANVDWRELIRPLAGARVEWLAAAGGLALSVEAVKTARWQVLLGLGFSAWPRLAALVLSSRLLNNLAPLRAGDLWRAASVARAERKSLVLAGGSVVAEKALDGVALGATSLLLLPRLDVDLPRALLLAVALGLVAASVLALAWRAGKGAALVRWAAEARHLRDGRVLVGLVALTAAGMALGILVNLAVLGALGLGVDPAVGAMVLVAGYAAGLVPAASGQIGVFELAVAAPLMAMGLPPASSVAAALALHLVLLATLGLGGALALPLGLLATRLRVGQVP